jgi:hypothetical protein
VAKLNRLAARHGGWTRTGFAWVAAALLLLWLSGIVLYAWPAEAAFDLAPWQTWTRRVALVAHGSSVWVLCFLAGHWLWGHVGLVWQRRRNSTWVLGILGAALLLSVAFTGLLLLYGPEPARGGAAAVHWWSALALPLLLGVHGRAWFRWR